MWEAIGAIATCVIAYLAWQKHQREREESETKRQESSLKNYWEISSPPTPPRRRHRSFQLTEYEERKGCYCGFLYWLLWMIIMGVVVGSIPSTETAIIIFIIGIFLGRYIQKKIHRALL
ncbi:MAG: hypothetical protein F6K35_42970 [Okeania sp. SIO2H7]|nr:hypothetical protein [Okeania sp. SIO2H7]